MFFSYRCIDVYLEQKRPNIRFLCVWMEVVSSFNKYDYKM